MEVDVLAERLKKLDAETLVVDGELSRYTSQADLNNGHAAKRIDFLRAQLGSALSTSHELASLLQESGLVASRISGKIRAIDLEKSRVQQSLDYVEKVMLLKRSVLGAQSAMDARDWESAAKCIADARKLPDSLVDGEFARAMVPTSELPDFPVETIKATSDSLNDLFLREFGKATAAKDMESVTRYFKLFPLIGHEKEGLDVYARFIRGFVTAHSRTILQSRPQTTEQLHMFYGNALSGLFETIASIVAQHAPIVEKHYGPGRMGRVCARVQDEADAQGGLIVDSFWDEQRIDKVVSDVKQYSFASLVSSFTRSSTAARTGTPDVDTTRDDIDLRQVNDLITEASIMLNRWTLYRKFLATNLTLDVDDANGPHNQSSPDTQSVNSGHTGHSGNAVQNGKKSTLKEPQLAKESGFANKVSVRLAPTVEVLATFAMRRTVEMAFEMDELPDLYQAYTPEAPLTSSVVDDVMFILSTLVKQVVSSGEITLIKNTLSNFRRIMESDYVGLLQRRLRDEAPKQLMATSAPSTSGRSGTPPVSASRRVLAGLSSTEERRLRAFLVYLNNLLVSYTYVERILKEVPVEADVPFDTDGQQVRSLLESMTGGFKSRCNELINDGIQVTFSTVVAVRLRNLTTQMFRNAHYMLSAEEASAEGRESSISAIFKNGWDQLMTEFGRIMAPDNYKRLQLQAATLVSRLVEKWLWSLEGKVNELGAIKLDRDIGRIITTASSDAYKLREKFVRVAQIITILGFDDEEEEEHVTWYLTDEERSRARMIRVERRPDIY
uniref:Conserved oligomeric Golgi complex subunit 4 n=1 Tax=Blastobotrys adeninivorans TaxID=409370 RepID=A0A060SWE0_BLAAD